MAERLTKYLFSEDRLSTQEIPKSESTEEVSKEIAPVLQFRNNTLQETTQEAELPQDLENGAVMLAGGLDTLYKHLEALDSNQITAFVEKTTSSLKNTALPNGRTEIHNLIWTDMIYNLRKELQGISDDSENLKITRETIHNRLIEDIQKDPDTA